MIYPKVFALLSIMMVFGSSSYAQQRPQFDKTKDILLAQFDIKGDLDDIHAVAALGSMLRHEQFEGVLAKTYAVQGSVERLTGTQFYVPELMSEAFGPENTKWYDALANYDHAVTHIKEHAVSALKAANNTGRVWVMEAGQSGFSHDWLKQIIDENNGISARDTKQRVIVVQHSWYNEEKSTQDKLAYLMKNTRYVQIDDGNYIFGEEKDRGPNTARLQGRETEDTFTPGDPKWMNSAISENNKNLAARKLWTMAHEYIQALPSINGKLHQQGGTDYSDVSEALWIFDINETIDTNSKFWHKYVTTVKVQ